MTPETDEARGLREEVARLRAALDAERRHTEQWRALAEERRVAAERLRQHPIVRLLLPLARVLLPRTTLATRRLQRTGRRAKRAVGRLRTVRHRFGAATRERQLRRDVRALGPVRVSELAVTAVVLTRDGRANLERLLPALRAEAELCPLQVIIVDNGSGSETARWLREQHDVMVLSTGQNLSFSAGNNLGARAASHPRICFLNDDVEPVAAGWLVRMLEALDGDVAAVGAQLVYPRQGLLSGHTRDISVQHDGIDLGRTSGGDLTMRNRRSTGQPRVDESVREVFAATAACLLVDAAAFWEVGGFDEQYVYGSEDVDLCWGLRKRARRIVVVESAVLLHYEGATRHKEDPATLRSRQARNRLLLLQKHAPTLNRALFEDQVTGRCVLAAAPLKAAITVTRNLESAGYGDFYTAHELGSALTEAGWAVSYVERYGDAWYEQLGDVDAVIVLLDAFDVRRVPPGVLTVAWIRNWLERWTAIPWFEQFDVVLTSSHKLAEQVREVSSHEPVVFPLATDPRHFRPRGATRAGAVFTGNHWGEGRLTKVLGRLPELDVYGKGWGAVPSVVPAWRGHLAYDDLPAVYARARFVLDEAAVSTRRQASVNSRVFDALAAGALPVTDQDEGADELFGPDLPRHRGDLPSVEAALGMGEEERVRRVETLRKVVLAEHTYEQRARTLQTVLLQHVNKRHIAVVTGVPAEVDARTWGDWHFARGFADALVRRGWRATVHTRRENDIERAHAADVLLYLHGRGDLPAAEGQVTVLWCISHPEELSTAECDAADLVLVASHTSYGDDVALRTATPVRRLLQATDHRRFRPRPPVDRYRHPVAFVGNSRFVERAVVRDARAAGLEPAVYGANWGRFLPAGTVVAEHVPNEELPILYSSVGVLLNDHWDGMRSAGIASNRLFDALACGTVVVSDELPGLEELFEGGVVTYSAPEDLQRTVARLLRDDEERRGRAVRGSAAVLGRHTFDHRAAEFLQILDECGLVGRTAA
jgi:GT2 family glycosyltransferase/spore maturation protein CgeB